MGTFVKQYILFTALASEHEVTSLEAAQTKTLWPLVLGSHCHLLFWAKKEFEVRCHGGTIASWSSSSAGAHLTIGNPATTIAALSVGSGFFAAQGRLRLVADGAGTSDDKQGCVVFRPKAEAVFNTYSHISGLPEWFDRAIVFRSLGGQDATAWFRLRDSDWRKSGDFVFTEETTCFQGASFVNRLVTRFSNEVPDSVSTGPEPKPPEKGKEGEIRVCRDGEIRRLYVFCFGMWRWIGTNCWGQLNWEYLQ